MRDDNYQREMTLEELEREILKVKAELCEQMRLKAEQKARNAEMKAEPKKPGRKRISEELIEQIKSEAIEKMNKPLSEIALKHNVGITTLYNYGIKRKELKKEIIENNFPTIN